MKKLIQEIVNTDKASRLDVEKAVARREQLNDEINEQKAAFDEKCKVQAHQKIELAKAQASEEIAKAKADMQADLELKTKCLKSAYNENHISWQRELFNRVTK